MREVDAISLARQAVVRLLSLVTTRLLWRDEAGGLFENHTGFYTVGDKINDKV